MSGFDENPFGEPNVNDPFADSVVRKAASSVPNRGIDDYNPFADQGGSTATQVRGASNPPPPFYGGTATTTQQPAMLQTSSQEAPPPYARSGQQSIPQTSTGVFSPPSQSSNQTWKENDEINNTSYYPRRNNCPPLPEKCCVQPCFYQDIDVEIQTEFRKIVRGLYYLWMFHGLVLILNVIGGFAMMLAYSYVTTFGLGILYLILFIPFSFVCWFRPAYQAFKSDSSINFMVFFFVFFFQTVVTVIQSIGIPGSGTCGIITATATFKSSAKDMFMGTLLLCIAIMFIIAATCDVILLTKVHRIYRSTGASMSKAQEEFTSTFLRNEHVQNAASNVAATAVRAQVNNMTQPRY